MMNPILTSAHLSDLIDECCTNLKDGNGLRMLDLAGLLHALSQATKNDVFLALPQPAGVFGQEIAAFKSLISIPILEQNTREKNKQLLDACVKEGVEALVLLKKELCDNHPNCDCEKVISAIAKLNKSSYELNKQRRALMGAHPPSGRQFEEE